MGFLRESGVGLVGGVRAIVPFLCIPLLAGASCLPRTALTRHAAAPADRYAVCADVTFSEERSGPEHARGWCFELHTRWARAFRDGSAGRWVAMRAVVEHDGDPARARPSRWDGAWMELRQFETGAILAVSPLPRGLGLEVLDLAWATLSPHLPALVDGRGHDVASVPAQVDDPPDPADEAAGLRARATGPAMRTVMDLDWAAAVTPATFRWNGTLRAGSGGRVDAVSADGTFSGEVRFAPDGSRVLSARSQATRTVRVSEGARVHRQRQAWSIRVDHLGTVEAPRFAQAPGVEDARNDARPLRLADGTTAWADHLASGRVPTSCASAGTCVPFLVGVSSEGLETR